MTASQDRQKEGHPDKYIWGATEPRQGTKKETVTHSVVSGIPAAPSRRLLLLQSLKGCDLDVVVRLPHTQLIKELFDVHLEAGHSCHDCRVVVAVIAVVVLGGFC